MGERVWPGDRADDVMRRFHRPIQSRNASLSASLSVLRPESTGMTRAPDEFHAEHVEVLPADVLGAHVDIAGRPNTAAAVAVPTPC